MTIGQVSVYEPQKLTLSVRFAAITESIFLENISNL